MGGELVRARVGVVGAGWWSTRVHLPSLAAYERAELVGVADVETGRAERAAAAFGGRPFASLTELIDSGVDAVVIATTHDSHYPLAKEAIASGADVMVEKPMVIEPGDGRELVRLAAANGCRLHVGYPYPHSAHARRARDAIRRGRIGEIHLVVSTFATGAGVLYRDAARFDPPDDALLGPDPATYRDPASGGQARGQMTHSVSAMLFVTGLDATSVSGYVSTTGLEVDMVDAAAFETRQGAVGTVASTGSVPFGVRPVERLDVYGSAGHLHYGMSAGTLSIHGADGDVDADATVDGPDRYPERQPARHLVDCFLDRCDPLVDGRLGADTAAFIDAFVRAAADGQRHEIGSASDEEG
jgi:predicted dehydrogenase